MPGISHEGLVALFRDRPVLVIAPSASVARWASKRRDLGGGNSWAPHVLGPELVPVVTEVEEATRDPELAVLSALSHGSDSAARPERHWRR